MTKILSGFSRPSSQSWSRPPLAAALSLSVRPLVLPTLTTVLAPRFSALASPLRTALTASSRSSRPFAHGRAQTSDTRGHRGAKQSCDYFPHYIPPLAYADALCVQRIGGHQPR